MTHLKTAAFVEYAKGTELEHISHAFAIPITTLRHWALQDRWAKLAPQFNALERRGPPAQPEAERAQARIKENRERVFRTARKLQEDLAKTVDSLLAGHLKIKRVFANGSSAETEPGLRDRQDLALYAKHVAELSYRALGDIESTRGAAEGGNSQAGQITIILPGVVAAPREKRAQVVDVDALVQEEQRGAENTRIAGTIDLSAPLPELCDSEARPLDTGHGTPPPGPEYSTPGTGGAA